MRWWFAAVAALAMAGCARDESDTAPPLRFAPELNVNLDAMTHTGSGLYFQDLQEGAGDTAQAGARVTVHYTGWLTDGSKFDSSVDRHEPFQFTLARGEVIQGWDEGVQGMRVGGTRKLVIPPHLGYGARGAGGVIPPNATLVFDVELLAVN